MTTIISIKTPNKIVMAADGQTTGGATPHTKHTIYDTKKKKIYCLCGGKLLVAFSGNAIPSLYLMEKIAEEFDKGKSLIDAAATTIIKLPDDPYRYRGENFYILAADKNHALKIMKNSMYESEDEILTIGSGGDFALVAARALLDHTNLAPEAVATEAVKIAGRYCATANDYVAIETLDREGEKQ